MCITFDHVSVDLQLSIYLIYLSTMFAFESTAQGQWHQPEEVTELIAQTQQSSEDLVYNNEKVTDMTHHSIS